MDGFSTYNSLLGRPALSDLRAVVAPWCLTKKFPATNGVEVGEGNQGVSREHYVAELRENKRQEKGKRAEVAFCTNNSIA